MTSAEQLVEIEAIKQLKARYFRFMDQRDWAGLATTLAMDIDFEHPTIGRHLGAVAAMDGLRERLEALAFTAHHGCMPEITIHSRTAASGIWSLHSCVIRIAQAGGPQPRLFQGYGRYFDTFVYVAGAWRIQSLRLEHLYKES